jgi:hypothetical protein
MPDAVSAAERVLNDLGIRDLHDLRLLDFIAWERGALVNHGHLHGAEGRLMVVGTQAVITVSTAIKSQHRRRFTIAHELGHFEMHHHGSHLRLCLHEDIDHWRSHCSASDNESQANEFAAALLLPERSFAPLCLTHDPSLDLIIQLANTFDVSLTATALRYSRFCDQPVAVVFSQDGKIKWFRGSNDFDEAREDLEFFVDVRGSVDSSTCAGRFFQGHRIPNRPRAIPASAWFTPGRYRPEATVQEHSLSMPTYNAVLTLLWIDDDIEDEGDFSWFS